MPRCINAVTSLEVRELIVKLRKEDKRSIGEIADIVRKSKSVVYGILKRFEKTGSCKAKKLHGRPRKTTSKDDRWITLKSKKDRFSTTTFISKKARDYLGIKVLRHTVSRRRNKQHLIA